MASYDVYRCTSLFLFLLFSNSEPLLHVRNNGLYENVSTHVVLRTRPGVSFNACVDPLYDFQVIYWALTRQLTTG
jgi:hypothetical protein